MKTVLITVEVYDDSTVEDVEKAIDSGLNDVGINCIYNVEEKEE